MVVKGCGFVSGLSALGNVYLRQATCTFHCAAIFVYHGLPRLRLHSPLESFTWIAPSNVHYIGAGGNGGRCFEALELLAAARDEEYLCR
jgi:hypothetical protein